MKQKKLSFSNLKFTRPTIAKINTTNLNFEKSAKRGLQSGLLLNWANALLLGEVAGRAGG